MLESGYVLGIGSVNLDIMGRSKDTIIPADSNPGHIELSVGGVTHNICENAARLGVDLKFITATGDDYFAEVIKDAFRRQGIPTDDFVTIDGSGSSIYMSVHNTDGEMNVAVSDMSVLQHLTVDHLKARESTIQNASAIVFDTGLPREIIDYILKEYGDKIPVFADPVSTTYARKLLDNLEGVFVLKPSIMEAETLSGVKIQSAETLIEAARVLNEKGARHVFISLGADGIFYRGFDGRCVYRKNEPVDGIVNTTGAGDSFMGALLYSYMNGYDVEEAVRIAMAVSSLTIMSEHTVNPLLNRDFLVENLDRFVKTSKTINDIAFE